MMSSLSRLRGAVRRVKTAWLPVPVLLLAVLIAAMLLTWPTSRRGRPAQRHGVSVPIPVAPPAVEEQLLLPIDRDTAVVVNERKPILSGPLPAARPSNFVGTPESLARATDCLAAAAWYEAGDDAVGQRAVMQVVLNRDRHPAFPNSVCAVVFQGSERKTGCQFTFTCDGSLLHRKPGEAEWRRARVLATEALTGTVDPAVGYATHYHANYVVPYWADDNDKIAQVGLHIFYRWKGFWGTARAFRRPLGADEPTYAALAALSPAHGTLAGITVAEVTLPADASAPMAVIPPPLEVEGVREKSLRGAVVRGRQDDANQFFLQLDAATFPGNYATAAVALCKGRPRCMVLGWRDATQMAHALPLSPAARGALTFYFEQRGAANDTALWNCQQIPRSNKAQCLDPATPIPGAAVPDRPAQ